MEYKKLNLKDYLLQLDSQNIANFTTVQYGCYLEGMLEDFMDSGVSYSPSIVVVKTGLKNLNLGGYKENILKRCFELSLVHKITNYGEFVMVMEKDYTYLNEVIDRRTLKMLVDETYVNKAFKSMKANSDMILVGWVDINPVYVKVTRVEVKRDLELESQYVY